MKTQELSKEQQQVTNGGAMMSGSHDYGMPWMRPDWVPGHDDQPSGSTTQTAHGDLGSTQSSSSDPMPTM